VFPFQAVSEKTSYNYIEKDLAYSLLVYFRVDAWHSLPVFESASAMESGHTLYVQEEGIGLKAGPCCLNSLPVRASLDRMLAVRGRWACGQGVDPVMKESE